MSFCFLGYGKKKYLNKRGGGGGGEGKKKQKDYLTGF